MRRRGGISDRPSHPRRVFPAAIGDRALAAASVCGIGSGSVCLRIDAPHDGVEPIVGDGATEELDVLSRWPVERARSRFGEKIRTFQRQPQ